MWDTVRRPYVWTRGCYHTRPVHQWLRLAFPSFRLWETNVSRSVPSFTIFSYGKQNILCHLEHQVYSSAKVSGDSVSGLAGWFLFRVLCEAVSEQTSGPLLPEGWQEGVQGVTTEAVSSQDRRWEVSFSSLLLASSAHGFVSLPAKLSGWCSCSVASGLPQDESHKVKWKPTRSHARSVS